MILQSNVYLCDYIISHFEKKKFSLSTSEKQESSLAKMQRVQGVRFFKKVLLILDNQNDPNMVHTSRCIYQMKDVESSLCFSCHTLSYIWGTKYILA